ncbi:MAG: low temperature requirement protein A, partial [Lachnospiraceae bacterium]|nr:low temperature requirement protein A [Lachnospiraceae bacterium]
MINDILRPKEKKVEYVELIYDLIFVYIVGRNNLLLHNFENGFISSAAFLSYIMTTLAVIQIWNFTTYYINIYGKHGIRDHIFLFINMFLLYFVAEGTRTDWQEFHTQYHIAWA